VGAGLRAALVVAGEAASPVVGAMSAEHLAIRWRSPWASTGYEDGLFGPLPPGEGKRARSEPATRGASRS